MKYSGDQRSGIGVAHATRSASLVADSSGSPKDIDATGVTNVPGVVYNGGTEKWQPATVGGMANPMTTAQDLIVAGSGGAPARLAVGADGQPLMVRSDGTPGYVNTAIYAAAWGVKADASTDDTTEIRVAINAAALAGASGNNDLAADGGAAGRQHGRQLAATVAAAHCDCRQRAWRVGPVYKLQFRQKRGSARDWRRGPVRDRRARDHHHRQRVTRRESDTDRRRVDPPRHTARP